MPSNFDYAFQFLVDKKIEWNKDEGATRLKDDAGGLTKYGISQRAHPDVDVVNLTLEEAKEIYHKKYWDSEYDYVQHADITNKLFVIAINTGAYDAHTFIQTALNDIYKINDLSKKVEVDGNFGPKTLAAINTIAVSPAGVQWLMDKFKVLVMEHYLKLDDERRARGQSTYLASWLRRTLA